jgi:SAM-dependent methyltransferase
MTMPMSSSVVTNSIDRAAFENFYAGPAPWDIGKPQPAFTAVADQVTGPILDAGCGTGEHALFFAALGHTVVGVDFVDEAIRRARAKAAERGLAVQFLVKDAAALAQWGERFASVIDCGQLSSNTFPAGKGRTTEPISRPGVANISATTTMWPTRKDGHFWGENQYRNRPRTPPLPPSVARRPAAPFGPVTVSLSCHSTWAATTAHRLASPRCTPITLDP